MSEHDHQLRQARLSWQCSYCHFGFSGPYQENCPSCGMSRYWTGSVFPDAKPWPGRIVTGWHSHVYQCPVGTVVHGATTPWSWASLPGLSLSGHAGPKHFYDLHGNRAWSQYPDLRPSYHQFQVWCISERRTEGRR